MDQQIAEIDRENVQSRGYLKESFFSKSVSLNSADSEFKVTLKLYRTSETFILLLTEHKELSHV